MSSEARARARELADEGANAYARRDYERAHRLLVSAYDVVPAPTILVLDARALVQLGRWLDARNTYERALATPIAADAPPPFQRAVESARDEIAALRAKIPSLAIRLSGTATVNPTVRVLLDGRPLAAESLGSAVDVDPGIHRLRTRADGHEEAAYEVSLAPGEQRRLTVELGAPRRHSAPAHDFRRAATFLSFGMGSAGLATGVVSGVVAMHARAQAEQRCPDHRCETGSPGASAVDRFRTYRTISTIGYATGAVGVGLGLFFVLIDRAPRIGQVGLAPTLNGVQLVGAL